MSFNDNNKLFVDFINIINCSNFEHLTILIK